MAPPLTANEYQSSPGSSGQSSLVGMIVIVVVALGTVLFLLGYAVYRHRSAQPLGLEEETDVTSDTDDYNTSSNDQMMTSPSIPSIESEVEV